MLTLICCLGKDRMKRFDGTPKKLYKYIDKTKVEEMLELARRDNKRNYLILLTFWRTGMRNDELTKLKKEHIKPDRVTIHQGKGCKDRIIPLDGHLYDLLSYHMADMNLEDKLFDISTTQVRNIVHKYEGDESIHPHTLRHSFAVHCLKQGMNIRSLQKILGHAHLDTTAVYLDLLAEDIMDDFKKVEW